MEKNHRPGAPPGVSTPPPFPDNFQLDFSSTQAEKQENIRKPYSWRIRNPLCWQFKKCSWHLTLNLILLRLLLPQSSLLPQLLHAHKFWNESLWQVIIGSLNQETHQIIWNHVESLSIFTYKPGSIESSPPQLKTTILPWSPLQLLFLLNGLFHHLPKRSVRFIFSSKPADPAA